MANFLRKITLGPAIGESLVDFPVRICFRVREPRTDGPFQVIDPVPWDNVDFSLSSDHDNKHLLAFTKCPGWRAVMEGDEFCVDVAIPHLSCDKETVIWLVYGEGVEGKALAAHEFWTALGYACQPQLIGVE